MPLTPEEFVKKFTKERKLVEQGADPRYTRKVLKGLAPVYSYDPKAIDRLYGEEEGGDLLDRVKSDNEVGYLLPPGLVIGGYKGLCYADLLSASFREKKWWKMFRDYMDIYEEVVWVLPVRGAGNWVIHNVHVSMDRHRPAIVIPARSKGLNHVRVIRLELFIEEHSYE